MQYTDCVYFLITYEPHADNRTSRNEGREIGGSIGHHKLNVPNTKLDGDVCAAYFMLN
jgi:hypothetical protein